MFAIFSLSWSGAAYAGRRLASAGGDMMRRFARFGRAIKNRRAATALAGLDDHMLADIGITRSDLRDAYSEPLWHDPTDVLVGRAAERRTRRRSALVQSDSRSATGMAALRNGNLRVSNLSVPVRIVDIPSRAPDRAPAGPPAGALIWTTAVSCRARYAAG